VRTHRKVPHRSRACRRKRMHVFLQV